MTSKAGSGMVEPAAFAGGEIIQRELRQARLRARRSTMKSWNTVMPSTFTAGRCGCTSVQSSGFASGALTMRKFFASLLVTK